MKIGTKSVLFGAHCFFLHPWFVAAAWWKLNGFPWDPRLWVAFFVHDIGYLGKPNMDGEEGERHPMTGANICGRLFDHEAPNTFLTQWKYIANILGPICNRIWGRDPQGTDWYCFCFYHSRFLAKRYGVTPSRLCPADKLSICLTPAWLYLPMVRLSGEIHEYMKLADTGKYATMNIPTSARLTWYRGVQDYLRQWVDEHRDGRPDAWTPESRQAQNQSGVWK